MKQLKIQCPSILDVAFEVVLRCLAVACLPRKRNRSTIIGANRGFDTFIEDRATPNDAATLESVVAATNANVHPRNARYL
jgi:hypothetical protein